MTATPCAVCCSMVRAWCTVLDRVYLCVVCQAFARHSIIIYALPICAHAVAVAVRLQHLPCCRRVCNVPTTCCIDPGINIHPFVCACPCVCTVLTCVRTGTTAVDMIVNAPTTGFLPLLAGTATGALYGDGTYFARDASYSNNYASRLPSGQRQMLVVDVVVGRSTPGQQGMKMCPVVNLRVSPTASRVLDVSHIHTYPSLAPFYIAPSIPSITERTTRCRGHWEGAVSYARCMAWQVCS